jgi:hypothetical protein
MNQQNPQWQRRTDDGDDGFSHMTTSELEQAERELAEITGLIDEQFGIVTRLKRLGADTAERLLIELLELQQMREQRLAQARLQGRRLQRHRS